MIIIPLWLDNYDNAMIINDRGYGICLSANTLTEIQLTEAINKLLSDNIVKQSLYSLSQRIQCSDRLEIAANLIQNIIHFNE